MKKTIVFLAVMALLCTNVYAFKPKVNILTEKEIAALPNEKLLDTYVDILVELEALRSFHNTAGFMPKDYEEFKKVLRFRILLIQEIRKRDLEPPIVE